MTNTSTVNSCWQHSILWLEKKLFKIHMVWGANWFFLCRESTFITSNIRTHGKMNESRDQTSGLISHCWPCVKVLTFNFHATSVHPVVMGTWKMVWFVLFNDTLLSVRTFGVMYDHTFYKQVQISRSDIRPHIKWAVSLVILHMITSIFLRALCVYIWVNILTLSPRGGVPGRTKIC